jgi:trimethylamine--corrinoid protein Co-methyltransferase
MHNLALSSEEDLDDCLRLGHLAPFDDMALKQIEDSAARILEEVGIRFEDDPETLDLWRQHGAIVKEDRVFLDGAWLTQVIRKSAPKTFTLIARNPARNTIIGAGSRPVFAPIYGAPNVLLENGRRCMGTLEIYRQLVSMAHTSPVLSNTGHMVCVLNDVPEAARPMEMALAHLSYSDKPFMGSVTSPSATEQVIDAALLAIDAETMAGECNLLHLINTTPPLVYKENPLKCLRVVAEHQQACLVTSYMMMGATSPAAIAGALIQGYAEVLAGMALTQLWSPCAPVVMGIFAMPFSMTKMLPCFGDPASHLVQLYAVQLARRLGVPVRGDGGVTSAKVDDAQAGYESTNATSTAVLSGADFILHSAGWLEQGRCVSLAKFRREADAITETYRGAAEPCPPPLELDQALVVHLRASIRRSAY